MDSLGFALVESEYAKLRECIGDLGEAINATLSSQREELARTRKTELRRKDQIIETLKLEKSKLEESIATNERACLLENERDWYKKEALHLDKVLEDTKQHEKELAEKLEESNQDRKWMKAQMEKLTKSNWALQKKLKELGVDVNCHGYFVEEKDANDEAKPSSNETAEGAEFVTEADLVEEK